jgi:hypothetical protein
LGVRQACGFGAWARHDQMAICMGKPSTIYLNLDFRRLFFNKTGGMVRAELTIALTAWLIFTTSTSEH